MTAPLILLAPMIAPMTALLLAPLILLAPMIVLLLADISGVMRADVMRAGILQAAMQSAIRSAMQATTVNVLVLHTCPLRSLELAVPLALSSRRRGAPCGGARFALIPNSPESPFSL